MLLTNSPGPEYAIENSTLFPTLVVVTSKWIGFPPREFPLPRKLCDPLLISVKTVLFPRLVTGWLVGAGAALKPL